MNRIAGAALVAVLLSAAPAAQAEEWTHLDTTLQVAVGAALLGDYLQTRQIVRDGRETNAIMGPRGNRMAPEVYFPIVGALHTLAAVKLPQPLRFILQAGTVAVQFSVIRHNRVRAGYAFNF